MSMKTMVLGWRGCGGLVFALVFLGACSPYRLQGVVVEGPVPGVEVVGADDPRLEFFGLPGVEVLVKLDPQRLNPETIGRGRTDGDGRFSLAVDEFGAGVLILDVEVSASRSGFVTARERFELPGAGRRLVVTMRPGEDPPPVEGQNILEETLREAAPYLRD
ncbi:MAG: hypothetical protein AAFX76_12870 [Planctomycetota bacterium]